MHATLTSKGAFTFWSGGFWGVFAQWSKQTDHSNGTTTRTRGAVVSAFAPSGEVCENLNPALTPPRRPSDPTPTPAKRITPTPIPPDAPANNPAPEGLCALRAGMHARPC